MKTYIRYQKKNPPLQSVHLFFPCSSFTLYIFKQKFTSKTANQLPKKRSDTVVNETRFVLVLTDKCMPKLTSR